MMSDISSFLVQAKPKLAQLQQWPARTSMNLTRLKIPIPHRYRLGRTGQGRGRRHGRPRKARKSIDDGEPYDITKLQTSFNVMQGWHDLSRHQWRWLDLQYPAMACFMIFSLCVAPMPIFFKIAIPLVSILVCSMPATRQFFLPSMSIWIYLLYFFCSRFVPVEYRTHIWVKVLPALENVLYGANLSNILSAHTHPVLDLLAWLPYGIGHFAGPAVCALFIFVFAAPSTTPVFARTFGWLSITGVTVSLTFPCTPPWYEKANGLEPAHYGMPGNPAGLARVDKLLGFDMYTTSFTNQPMPFGAFPSMHSANATLLALFLSFCFPRLRAFFIFYVGWLWWATMYLNHHYAIDLVAGSLLATSFFYVARMRYLPRQQHEKKNRWAYEYIEIGEKPKNLDEEYGYAAPGYGMGLLERRSMGEDDEWTLGSSSSFSSSPRTSITSPTLMSPVTPHDDFAEHTTVGLTSQGYVYNGEDPNRESELSEVVVVR